ncbi:MAG: cation-translocating P-type ATPase [Ilumatobacteraceae bacterium]
MTWSTCSSSGVSLAVAAVPEGLPALLSIVLALGMRRMAERRAIVKRLASVETLGSASVICSDKTGTLTRNEMTVTEVRCATREPTPVELERLARAAQAANDATVGEGESVGDPTEIALLVASRQLVPGLEIGRRVGEVPFSSDRKMMSVITTEPDGLVLHAKGAPDVLLERCTTELVDGRHVELTEARRGELLGVVDELADAALRTIAVADRAVEADEVADLSRLDDLGRLEEGLTFCGILGLIDPPRPEARQAIEAAHGAGMRVIMITGDHPVTAARIADDLGVRVDGHAAVSGAELSGLSDADWDELVTRTEVFARVAPEHKLRIVEALQRSGAVVAMTGDGVNDAPALRAADIGVAMGITGTEVSKEAADMILADDDFATIVVAVREGRSILVNIRSFLRYLLSSNTAEVMTMLIGVVAASTFGLDGAGLAVPLLATQILWINLLTDSAPALALGFDPPPPDVMTRPPRRPDERIIDSAMLVTVGVLGAVMAGATLIALDRRLPGGLIEGSGSLADARTAAFTTLVLAQLFNCFNARSDHRSAFARSAGNRWMWAAVATLRHLAGRRGRAAAAATRPSPRPIVP